MATNFYNFREYSGGQLAPCVRHPQKLWINSLSRIALAIFLFLLSSHIVSSSECDKNTQRKCENGDCIVANWWCDAEPDCHDQSDEANCGNMTCMAEHFSCGPGLPCIPESWRCDSTEDCANGFDESVNCTHSCKSDEEFQCSDTQRCITRRWVCDYDSDCTDGSDEANCPPATCGPEQFKCTNGRCIPPAWRCDGDNDCADSSDELNCTATEIHGKQCMSYDFTCETVKECINKAWRCDGEQDCHDGSDEMNCTIPCSATEFQCHNKSCIDRGKRCDGVIDCFDKSDELHCHHNVSTCDAATQFDCDGTGIMCISLNQTCDQSYDCPSGADEDEEYCIHHVKSTTADNCTTPNTFNCSHFCYNISGHVQCGCPSGYQLHTNSRTCIDINECEVHIGICPQICVNTEGSYRCKCHEGFEDPHKDPKDHICRAVGEEPRLLFANRHDLREYRLHTSKYHALVDQLNSAIALDYDYREKLIYWSDVASESITRREMDVGDAAHTALVTTDLSTPDGLALDWVHKNLYWTDTGSNRIEVLSVANINSTWRMVLITDKLDEPRAIVVDPRNDQRFMYWTDWGDTPKIEKSNLDGSGRKTLMGSETNQSPGLVWPNGLTIDYDSNRLFWADAKLHLIGSSDLEGNHRRIVFTSFNYLKHPFALTVFEDDIYWSDWEAMSILKVSKHHGSKNNNSVKHIADHLYSPMDIHVYHALKQPTANNTCAGSPCDQLCFPLRDDPFFTCNCSTDYVLQPDKKTCKLVTTTTAPSISPTKPVGGTTSQNSSSAVEGQAGSTPGPQTSASGANVYSVLIGITVILLAAALIISFVYYRYFRIRAPKGLNFDNPVYRRTTEDDQFCIERSTSYLQPKALASLLEPLNSDRM